MTIFHFAGHILDLRRGCFSRDGQQIELRPKSFALLCYLVEHAGRLVARDELFEALWPDVIVTDDSLARCVLEIRRALGDNGRAILKTVPKRGYVLATEIASPPIDAPAPRDDAVKAPCPVDELPPSEIKFVTLMRVQLVEAARLVAGLGPESAFARLKPSGEAMAQAIRHFGGIVLKEFGGGMLAVFGAPFARENHAILACHAALDLVERIAQLPRRDGDGSVQARVGLHSGSVLAIDPQAGLSAVYDLVGAPVLTVEAVQAAAGPDQVVACADCRRLAEGHVAFEPFGADAGAGPLYRIAGIGVLPSWPVRSKRAGSRFVGRAAETEALLRAGETSLAGRGQTFCLIGEPGVGKSRLVHEVVGTLQNSAWHLVEIACDPISEASPYGAVKALVGQCLTPPLNSTEPIAARIRSPALGLPPLWQTALQALLDLDIADPAWQTLQPQQRGRAMADAACAAIEAALRERPIILLVEDLHWLDPVSAPILARIAGLGARYRTLILLTGRPDARLDWCDRHGLARLRLQPLDETEGALLVDALLGTLPRLAALKQQILRHAGGVPLFIEEVCRELLDRHGPVEDWNSALRTALTADLGVPSTIQGVVAQRIDRLDKPDRAVLQLAATAGSDVTVGLLRAAGGWEEDDLRARLDTLDRAGLLVETALLPQHAFAFRHEILRRVAYDSMVEARRIALHSALLGALEAAASADQDDRSAVLCHHATSAGDWQRAYRYAGAVARRCVQRSAFTEAARYFETAIDTLDRQAYSTERECQAIDLRLETRSAFMPLGRLDRWLDLARSAEERALSIADDTRRIAAMTMRSAALNFCGAPPEAIAVGQEAVGLAGQLDCPGWLSYAEYNLGQAYFVAGRCREAERLLGHAYDRLTGPEAQAPPGTDLAAITLVCCVMKSVAHAGLGETEQAELFQRRAAAIAAESPRPYHEVASGYAAGVLHLARGDPAAAQAALETSLALARQWDVTLFGPIVACNLGIAHYEQGQLETACQVLEEARAAASAIRHASVVLRTSIYLGLALCHAGHDAAGASLVERARVGAREQGYEAAEAEALYAEAVILSSLRGEKASIAAALRAGLAIAERLDAQPQKRKLSLLWRKVGADTEYWINN